MMTMPAKNVSEYLSTLEGFNLERINQIREYILAQDSRIEEGMGYGVLSYKIGKKRIYLASFKDHTGIYPGYAFMERHKDELGLYKPGTGTIHFFHNLEIPIDLVHKIVKEVLLESK